MGDATEFMLVYHAVIVMQVTGSNNLHSSFPSGRIGLIKLNHSCIIDCNLGHSLNTWLELD